jgi:folylpolyglutamate synthase/dihydropteroate synthase
VAISQFETLDEAMDRARTMAGEQDTILVFGSFMTVAVVMKWLENSMQCVGQ